MKQPTYRTIMAIITFLLPITTTAYTQSPVRIKKDRFLQMFRVYLDNNHLDNAVRQDSLEFGEAYKNFFHDKGNIQIVDSLNPSFSEDDLEKEMRSIWDEKHPHIVERTPAEAKPNNTIHDFISQWEPWSIATGTIFVLAIIVVFCLRARKKRKTEIEGAIQRATAANGNDDAGIIVTHKTLAVLQKQNIDDVVGNGNYLEVSSGDFCDDSAVTKMYIKNTCIIDIYNMYAEDLRNPNNPKEDGCMVLGRWVHDEKNNDYCISLEEIVKPGSDAIFTEYQLNFGGQIKIKMMERLKKLRRETELQYDLTCWVHSHPGLDVFFSNDDNNVHLLHKHPVHPKFLTAIVVDILTPEQKLGIFTFKHDETVNSKNELRKTYSLTEWYKWAIESKRNSFRSEDHYNTLAEAQSHSADCCRIELTNGVVVDMDMLTALQQRELVHFVHGFTKQDAKQCTHVAIKIDEAEFIPEYELVGCFVVVNNRSLPSIIKATSNYYNRIKFVLAYSSSDGLLTTIPVINNELCADESFYGEQPLEDLKIWIRRKR